MVVYYLDTSAILKRYRTEKGTEVVEALYGLPDVFLVTSHFACLEVEAVSAKLLKGKSLTEEAYDALLNAFAADLGDPLYAMPLTSRIINEAIEAARENAVRAPDAIHIASGRAVQSAESCSLSLLTKKKSSRRSPTILRFVRRMERQAGAVRCCYEAGPCGFELQRALTGPVLPYQNCGTSRPS